MADVLICIHAYMNNPTQGTIDGVLISEGDASSAIVFPIIDAGINQISNPIKLATRTLPGYETSGNTTVAAVGISSNKWSFSLDGLVWGAWGAPLLITSVITTVNTVFYARVTGAYTEEAQTDNLVKLRIIGKVATL